MTEQRTGPGSASDARTDRSRAWLAAAALVAALLIGTAFGLAGEARALPQAPRLVRAVVHVARRPAAPGDDAAASRARHRRFVAQVAAALRRADVVRDALAAHGQDADASRHQDTDAAQATRLRRALRVTAIGGTDLLEIELSGEPPARAAPLVDALVALADARLHEEAGGPLPGVVRLLCPARAPRRARPRVPARRAPMKGMAIPPRCSMTTETSPRGRRGGRAPHPRSSPRERRP